MAHPRPIISELNLPNFPAPSIPNYIALVNIADYVISVDTSYFHCAGGLHRPLMGIFGYINGKVYGKYYDFELVQKHIDNRDWDCGPCYDYLKCTKAKSGPYPCITEIDRDMLVDGIERMFKRWPWKTEKEV